MRVLIALTLAISLALGGCSHPNQAAYAMRGPAPLARPTNTSLIKPRVLPVKTVSRARSPIHTISQVANLTPTKPSPLPVRKSTEAPSVPPTASVALSATTRHYLVADTVGNCSVIDSKPSDGLRGIGEKDGYASKELANEAMKREPKCKGARTGEVGQNAEVRFKAAEAKAKKLGVHNLTQEDIEGLTYDQIKELRGY
jgi:hypothetical protein